MYYSSTQWKVWKLCFIFHFSNRHSSSTTTIQTRWNSFFSSLHFTLLCQRRVHLPISAGLPPYFNFLSVPVAYNAPVGVKHHRHLYRHLSIPPWPIIPFISHIRASSISAPFFSLYFLQDHRYRTPCYQLTNQYWFRVFFSTHAWRKIMCR